MNRKYYGLLAGLLALNIIPSIAGVSRLYELLQGAEINPENARFFAAPFPIILHIISSSSFGLMGAFQFLPGLRRPFSRWHQRMGKLVWGAGIVSALTALWLTLFYPTMPQDGPLLIYLRLIFSLLMLFALTQSVSAMLQGKVTLHRRWSMRAYAIALGGGTQVFTHFAWFVFAGAMPTGLYRDALMGLGWVFNLWVVESLLAPHIIKQREGFIST